jgi:peptidoglycan/LPS O-acetylase OafA/YrhL
MILPLESFRGIFALTIALHHFKINTLIYSSNYIQNGSLVVDFFFVLSGFVIAFNYIDKINSKKEIITFQKKRFYRLYPLHLLTLLIFVFIEVLKIFIINYTDLEPTYLPFDSFNNYYSLVSNFFLLHGLYGTSYNIPSWSISAEFYVYFIFALIVYKFINQNKFFYLLIVISLIVFLLEHYGLKSLQKFIYPTRCLYSFFIGVLTYYFFNKNQKKINYILPLICLLMSIVFIIKSHKLDVNFRYIIAPLFFAPTIFFTANLKNENFYYKILSNKFFVYLGSLSYGIYMIHFAVIWFFRQISKFFYNVLELDNLLIFDKSTGIIITVFFIALLIFLSHISLHYFEKKFRFKNKKKC